MKKFVGFFLNLFSTIVALIGLVMVLVPIPCIMSGGSIGLISFNPLSLIINGGWEWYIRSLREFLPIFLRLVVFFAVMLMFFLNVAFLVKSRQSGSRPLITAFLAVPSAIAYMVYLIVCRRAYGAIAGKAGALFIVLVVFAFLAVATLALLIVVLDVAYVIAGLLEKAVAMAKTKKEKKTQAMPKMEEQVEAPQEESSAEE